MRPLHGNDLIIEIGIRFRNLEIEIYEIEIYELLENHNFTKLNSKFSKRFFKFKTFSSTLLFFYIFLYFLRYSSQLVSFLKPRKLVVSSRSRKMILRRCQELGVYKITISWKISRVVKYGGESYRECWGKFASSTTRVPPNEASNLRLDYRRMSISSHLESARMPTLTTPRNFRMKILYKIPLLEKLLYKSLNFYTVEKFSTVLSFKNFHISSKTVLKNLANLSQIFNLSRNK